jgi:hypothetical protein
MIGNGKREMGKAFRVQTLVCLFSRVETLKRDCEVRGWDFGLLILTGRQTKV